MRRLQLPLFALLVFATACAAGAGGAGTAATGDQDVLTAEDLAPYQGGSLYDAIDRARRQWMRSRGSDPVRVFLDGRELGGTGELRTIQVAAVSRAQYLEPREAQRQHGLGYSSGVIEVTSN